MFQCDLNEILPLIANGRGNSSEILFRLLKMGLAFKMGIAAQNGYG